MVASLLLLWLDEEYWKIMYIIVEHLYLYFVCCELYTIQFLLITENHRVYYLSVTKWKQAIDNLVLIISLGERSLFMAGGVAPKWKGLGKQSFAWVKGWVNEKQNNSNDIFPKHDSLKYWRLKSNVNSHMSIQYVNQPESLSWSFSESTCADNMKL
jgi:hypothetical protein